MDHYPSVKWPQLNYAKKDAEGVVNFLRSQGFEVMTLYDEQATKTEIIAKLQNELAPRVKKDDRVLFFFAGHGYTEELGEEIFEQQSRRLRTANREAAEDVVMEVVVASCLSLVACVRQGYEHEQPASSSIIQNKPQRIAGFTIHPNFVMQVRAGGAAGFADEADDVPALDFLSVFHLDVGEMAV
jgi:hypothetical protein